MEQRNVSISSAGQGKPTPHGSRHGNVDSAAAALDGDDDDDDDDEEKQISLDALQHVFPTHTQRRGLYSLFFSSFSCAALPIAFNPYNCLDFLELLLCFWLRASS